MSVGPYDCSRPPRLVKPVTRSKNGLRLRCAAVRNHVVHAPLVLGQNVNTCLQAAARPKSQILHAHTRANGPPRCGYSLRPCLGLTGAFDEAPRRTGPEMNLVESLVFTAFRRGWAPKPLPMEETAAYTNSDSSVVRWAGQGRACTTQPLVNICLHRLAYSASWLGNPNICLRTDSNRGGELKLPTFHRQRASM